MVFLSIQNYNQWKEEPVSTTITSAGLPISEVEFPSVVICSHGFNSEIFFTEYFQQVLDTADNATRRNVTNMSPNDLAKNMSKIATPLQEVIVIYYYVWYK